MKRSAQRRRHVQCIDRKLPFRFWPGHGRLSASDESDFDRPHCVVRNFSSGLALWRRLMWPAKRGEFKGREGRDPSAIDFGTWGPRRIHCDRAMPQPPPRSANRPVDVCRVEAGACLDSAPILLGACRQRRPIKVLEAGAHFLASWNVGSELRTKSTVRLLLLHILRSGDREWPTPYE